MRMLLFAGTFFICLWEIHCSGIVLGLAQYDVGYEDYSMFAIDVQSGDPSLLFNVTHSEPFTSCLFAIDYVKGIVFLFTEKELLGFGLKDGQLMFQQTITPQPYFTSLFFNNATNSLFGVCTGNSAWNWCEIRPYSANPGKIQILYLANQLFGAVSCLYGYSQVKNLYFFSDGPTVIGMDTISGTNAWKNTQAADSTAIVYDDSRDVLYGAGASEKEVIITKNYNGNHSSVLAKIPGDFAVSAFGTIALDQTYSKLYILLSNRKTYSLEPSAIAIVDLQSLTFNVVDIHFDDTELSIARILVT